MAQRFGGKFSPNGEGQTPPQPAATPPQSRDGFRTWVLFFLPLVFAVKAFQGAPAGMMFGLVACGLMIAAAWLTQQGLAAEQAYGARKVAKRPAFPRKIFGAVLMAAGLVAGGLMAQGGLIYPVIYGIAGAVLHLAAFGVDPMADKGMEGIDGFQVERVSRAVDEGEAFLGGMRSAILRAGDRGLEARVDKFATIARGLFRQVENDPGDLTAARKFLTVYLMGARDATVKFADAYAQGRDAKIRSDYEALLDDLETTFAERTKALLQNDHTDLDVEISVLRERLHLES
ncbi:MAG: 5-bromo-4-chloroindolyl phosphate hydrolysis family protein [Cypionkella sp.]